MAKKPRVNSSSNNNESSHLDEKLIPKITLTDIKLTEKQRKLIQLIDENEIIIITGPAGTSKTFIDTFYAIDAIKKCKFDKVVFSKPVEESGEKLGSLPGEIEDKIGPHYESFVSNMKKMLRDKTYEKLLHKEIFEFKPIAYLRGASFENSLMILDEAQNCDIRQIMLFMTRMGMNSKVIISGDIHQYDIAKDKMALSFFQEMVHDIEKVAIFEFTNKDQMRAKILIEITERYEKLKAAGKLPKNK